MVKWYALTFVHWKYWCSSNQGHWPWLRPLLDSGLAVMGQKASVGSFPPSHCPGRDVKRDILNPR